MLENLGHFKLHVPSVHTRTVIDYAMQYISGEVHMLQISAACGPKC
jgi:hypothetical protein